MKEQVCGVLEILNAQESGRLFAGICRTMALSVPLIIRTAKNVDFGCHWFDSTERAENQKPLPERLLLSANPMVQISNRFIEDLKLLALVSASPKFVCEKVEVISNFKN